ncbi:lipopolysaccharide export system permease protein [Devosia lucknowensis]|uniref:Lipopolysaccharide export system permease protein n=1 Tax=Devosia lucknowensis TaxID=1096929 RepID=A0A1Y6EN30_9HYPH|nr:LptF/LptG family permease [Devosia lucknowensis]SMQ62350.1 lipopolysaccharide export system permease protein [Devosia lucknowensis]
MTRLTRYLTKLFATDAMILFGIVCFLLWLVNCLRSFDVVSVKGQGFGTLALQALYTMPPLALSFFYICVGIGVVRALTALQTSHELHIIHTSGGLSGLWRATVTTCAGAMVLVLLLAHVIEPLANRQLNTLSAEVAADLVSSTLKPNRFTQVTPGVILLIGGRADGGQITEFFADDRRDPETRRTYIAASARVMSIDDDYVLQLQDGTLQYLEADGRYSEVRFARYDVSVDSLAQQTLQVDRLAETDSFGLIAQGLSSGWDQSIVTRLVDRSAEALRVLGLVLLVVSIAGFPSGNRTRIKLPLEAFVMLIAFGERGLSAYSPYGNGTGAVVLIAVAVALLAYRLWPRRPIRSAVA